MTTKSVTLKSSDQRLFEVGVEVGNLFKDFAMNEEENQLVITLNFVTADTLEKVLEWAEHEIQKPKAGDGKSTKNQASGMSDWEEQYLSSVLPRMLKVAKASFALDMKGLQNLFFQFVANWLRGPLHTHVPDILMFQLGRILKSNELAPRR